MASNYEQVCQQLREEGLLFERLELGTDRPVRCRVEGGDRERRGWYRLYELRTSSGDVLLVGSYGIWRGDDNGAKKIHLGKGSPLDQAERAALRARFAEEQKESARARARTAARAAHFAQKAWDRYEPGPFADCEYLRSKGVAAHGVRFTRGNAVVVPLCDAQGRIHGLQLIRDRKTARTRRQLQKEFFPKGVAKRGHFHLIGLPQQVVLVAEGYATAATVHEATGLPVAVAFDAGNLLPVAHALRKHYRHAKVLVCADDDVLQSCPACASRFYLPDAPQVCPACEKPHRRCNTGVVAASATALEVPRCAWIAPRFPEEGERRAAWLAEGEKAKPTDFNDLQRVAGAHVVRQQLEDKIRNLKWPLTAAARPTLRVVDGSAPLRPIQSVQELLDRFSLVYAHSGVVFDAQEHCLVSLSDMRDLCVRRDLHRSWSESLDRKVVRIDAVGFDPGGEEPQVTCNLFGGWPTVPAPGRCERLLELLRYMCSADPNSETLYQWVLRWVAYPIQHPGAKMKSTLVLHGPQGTGKNLFFEAVMAIYGRYGDVIDQSAIEDKFNDWASRKLFLIADEVVARSEVYHVKNKLKALITGERVRINPKNFAAYSERNHVNLVFLSNEAMPVVIEEDDRRHCVIWTPPKREPGYYRAIMDEIAAGGVAALHDELLRVDLGDFTNGSLPPMTAAKSELIDLALDSPLRFHDAVVSGDVRKIEPLSALATDWFEVYAIWCRRNNVRPAPQPKFINALKRHRDVPATRERYRTGTSTYGPHSILFLGDRVAPAGTDRLTWLGSQVIAGSSQLQDYRDV